MGTGDSVLQRDGAKIRQKNQTQLYFWPQAQQIGPTQVLCYIVKDKQCNASSAVCPYNTGFGVWRMMEESFTLETLSLILFNLQDILS